jgi:predicted membrane protein
MEDVKRNFGGRATLGGILVFIGALFLLRSLDIIYINIPHIIFSPSFVIFIIGILILINSRKKILGAIMVFIGGLWLLPRVFPHLDVDDSLIWSIAIIGLGLYILLRNRNKSGIPEAADPSGKFHRGCNSEHEIRKDFIDDVAIFGGGQRVVYSDDFKGGNITAIFGGSEIDLTNCQLAEGNNIIDVVAIFGGSEIRVPRDWHVIVNATPVFGGFSNKVVRDPGTPVDLSRTLIIKGVAIFGGIEVNSKIKFS